MQPAPYPSDVRAKGWKFVLDYERVIQSDSWALASARQQPLLLMLWFVAWQQVPCGSLPDGDELIAARVGLDTEEFQRHREILLRRWWKASDGRLYHPVLTEMVLEMLAWKARETQRKADYRARKQAMSVPSVSHGTDVGQTRESGGRDDTITGTITGTIGLPPSDEGVSAQATPDRTKPTSGIHDCPVQAIVDLYHRHLPDNPKVKVLSEARRKAIASRWRQAAKLDCRPFGYTTHNGGLSAWGQFFAICAESDFLTGNAPAQPGKPPFVADIDFLMSPSGFVRTIENRYHRQAAA